MKKHIKIIALTGAFVLLCMILVFNMSHENRMIHILIPKPNSTITALTEFSGEARGTWFFEASFPIEIYTTEGMLLGQGHAEAKSNWMTEDFVPWTASVPSFKAQGQTGYVRFKRDNPSGLPQNDAHIDIPIRF